MTADVPQHELRREIDATDSAFCEAFNAGQIDAAVQNTYTQDAVILPPGAEMVRGREDISHFWQAAADQMGIDRVDLQTVELTAAGAYAHQIGRGVLTLRGGQQVIAKYVVVWKQDGDRWRWHVDIWNTSE